MRVVIKGGVWKNTEDEILKAAISKYGKNQWARISSLLVRKTPKQCKARWYEWLDPSIKKTEWSREEDEKLLHLAKLMPTQWRTIAPIVGRTATQCLERYQKLLDEAEQRDNDEGAAGGSGLGLTGPGGGESAPTAEDVRRLRPGEIDPDPESKPARPDAVDMDEDEKEMLSEARARLANTQGKKAKRKARERALEEARRLAQLQKRRELKAAGITTKIKPPKNQMDYMTDIPFEKQPVAGFYDTTDEDARAVRAPVGKSIAQLDNPNHARREDEERKRKDREAERKKQSEQGKQAFSRQREEQLRKLQEQEQISKRRKLNLPEAQVGQRELDDIVKMGLASESARDLVVSQGGGAEGSEGLLAQYSTLNRALEARTPQVAPEEDTVMREARNLRNLANMQTPLLGDANVELHRGTGQSGALSSRSVTQTPNPLLTPMRSDDQRGAAGATPARQGSATPRESVAGGSTPMRTPLRTPLRDSLGLNMDDGMSFVGESSREMKRAAQAAKARLQQGLMGLPAPKNDFDIVLDEEEAENDGPDAGQEPVLEEDAAEREARLAKAEAERRAKELARRSQVVQRNLPRPANIDEGALLAALGSARAQDDDSTRAARLIAAEMIRLAKHDSIVYPIAGSMSVGGLQSDLTLIPDDQLQAAKDLVQQEMYVTFGVSDLDAGAKTRQDELKGLVDAQLDENTDAGKENILALEGALQTVRANEAWNAKSASWQDASTMSAEAIVAGQAARLEAIRHEMARQAGVASKEEKRLAKLLGGYQARSRALAQSITASFRSLEERSVERAAFERLQEGEQTAAEERQRALEREVAVLERRERMAQNIFRERDERRRDLKAQIEALEDELAMREAEGLNEAALAAEEEAS